LSAQSPLRSSSCGCVRGYGTRFVWKPSRQRQPSRRRVASSSRRQPAVSSALSNQQLNRPAKNTSSNRSIALRSHEQSGPAYHFSTARLGTCHKSPARQGSCQKSPRKSRKSRRRASEVAKSTQVAKSKSRAEVEKSIQVAKSKSRAAGCVVIV